MTNAEIIQAIQKEIERVKAEHPVGNFGESFEGGYDAGYCSCCCEIAYFLSTLESEKPMQEGLEEEISRYLREECSGDDEPSISEIARHFAQWGAEHSGSSEIPNDLKEAVKNHIYKAADSPGDDWITDDIRNAFIAGYKLHEANTPLPEDTVLFNKGVEEGKRLMMEESVKWLVDDDYHELTEKGRFILGSVGIGYNGYYIPYSDLLKLPKEDEK